MKFSKASVSAIERNIIDAKVTFDIKGWNFRNAIFYKKGNYTYIMYYANNVIKSGMVFVFNDNIVLDRFTLNNSDLINVAYDKAKDMTTLTYKLESYRYGVCDYLWGRITLKIPTDIINAKEDCSKFDCGGYDKFMTTYLPMKEKYLRQIDLSDIISWESAIKDNELVISLNLEVGKGYGDNHFHTDTYNFVFGNFSYECANHELYDNHHESQIVRKFINGITKFGNIIPQNVSVTIVQELD